MSSNLKKNNKKTFVLNDRENISLYVTSSLLLGIDTLDLIHLSNNTISVPELSEM